MARNYTVDVEVNIADYESEILAWVASEFRPEDVFSEAELREWAADHDLKEVEEG